MQATVTPDGPGTLGSGSVELILQSGDLRVAQLPAGCESDEDGIGNFTSVSCSRDFDAVPQTEVSFFVVGPEAIEFFVHATSPYGEDTAEFRATTAPAGADLAVSQFAPGSSMVFIENFGPVIAVGVVVELSDYTGSGEAAERISVGSIEVGGSATVDTLLNDDGRPFEITARVQSEIVDNDSTNNTAVLVRDDEHAEGCGCVALPAGETPGAGFVAIGLVALAAVARRRRREHPRVPGSIGSDEDQRMPPRRGSRHRVRERGVTPQHRDGGVRRRIDARGCGSVRRWPRGYKATPSTLSLTSPSPRSIVDQCRDGPSASD